MPAITYSLINQQDNFYEDLSWFTDQVVKRGNTLLPSMETITSFEAEHNPHRTRTASEYHLELLTMALYWRIYGEIASQLPTEVAFLGTYLSICRKAHPEAKERIDVARGRLMTKHLLPRIENDALTVALPAPNKYLINNDRLTTLIRWMSATGEFEEECRRFEIWKDALKRLPPYTTRHLFRGAAVLAGWFEEAAKHHLGKYTQNVAAFRQKQLSRHLGHEDIILCARRETEYHLMMVGAEIINRALKPQFIQTPKRIVLLPGCMRPIDRPCQATKDALDVKCAMCNPDCAVGQVQQMGQGRFETHVINHASDFAPALKKWRNTREYGIVASACVLHLFSGGYKMMALNIPTQCVFLKYAGCKRHWHPEGQSTSIHMDQLMKMVNAQRAPKNVSPPASVPQSLLCNKERCCA